MADTMMRRFTTAASRLVFSRFLMPAYERTVQLGWKLFRSTHSKSYLDESFRIVEKSRNLMLLEALRNSESAAFKGIYGRVYELWQKKLSDIFILRSKLDNEYAKSNKDKAKISLLTDSLSYLQADADSLTHLIKSRYPGHYSLFAREISGSPSDIQGVLKGTNTGVVEYYYGERGTYIFVITGNDRYFEYVAPDTNLKDSITSFIEALPVNNVATFSKRAYRFYSRYFAPAQKYLKDCKNIKIIPDGPLAALPFECLLTSTPAKNSSFRDLDYLLRDFCISYSPSAGLLIENMLRAAPGELQAFVGFSPGFSASMKEQYRNKCPESVDSVYLNLPEQRFSGRFLESLDRRFHAKIYAGQDATLNCFMKEATNYRIVHIASHSLVDPEDPLASRIVFAKEDCDKGNVKGYLYARDLYRMNLHSSLTVLGSCGTGKGLYRKGEGMISLAYGFSYAGCPSLVYSLWDVDEKETSSLLEDFYSELASGRKKDEALHNAKLHMLEKSSDITANPYYWAGFILSGNDEQIMEAGNGAFNWHTILICGLVIAVSLLVILFKLRRRSQ
jgi:CHAT domain-containing protein